jgi:benzoyl-CoA reductase/2-hydroxyglutaryl-CoA dehydratase subunit BcrC/BadD/HgdB
MFRDAALAALEMMVVEFGNLHYYSDMDEWTAVLEQLLATAEGRAARGERMLPEDALRVVWVTPPADPLLLTYVEEAGARVVGTEYVINQALEVMDEAKPPLEAIAASFMTASLIGTSRQRAASVIRQARERQAEGVVISGILGGSHCAMEARLVSGFVKQELDLPVLEFDVAPPSNEIGRQLQTRIDAFLEVLRGRR